MTMNRGWDNTDAMLREFMEIPLIFQRWLLDVGHHAYETYLAEHPAATNHEIFEQAITPLVPDLRAAWLEERRQQHEAGAGGAS